METITREPAAPALPSTQPSSAWKKVVHVLGVLNVLAAIPLLLLAGLELESVSFSETDRRTASFHRKLMDANKRLKQASDQIYAPLQLQKAKDAQDELSLLQTWTARNRKQIDGVKKVLEQIRTDVNAWAAPVSNRTCKRSSCGRGGKRPMATCRNPWRRC